MSTDNAFIKPIQVGSIAISQVVEMQFPFLLPADFLPNSDAEHINRLRDSFEPWALCAQTGKLILAVQTYVLKTSHHTIVVDTCVGCNKHSLFPFWHMRNESSWPARLAAAGVSVDDVDYVFCTHLHGDHIGWNTRLQDGRYVPTFPNATYIFAETEVEHARSGETARRPAYEQSVLPILEAGQAKLVDTDFALDDEVWLEPTPGHTPGHVAVHVQSKGQHAVLCGDVLHSPLQCLYPDWSSKPDLDKTLAAKTRRRLLESCLNEHQLLLPAHFPLPSAGYVTREIAMVGGMSSQTSIDQLIDVSSCNGFGFRFKT